MQRREFKFHHADRLNLLSENITITPCENSQLSRFGLHYVSQFNSSDQNDVFEAATQREMMLEDIRQKEFPQLPSRLNCLFAANTIYEAIHFAKSIIPVPIYNVRIFEVYSSNFLIRDSNWLDYITNDIQARYEYYKQYWYSSLTQHAPPEGERKPPTLEVLLPLPVRVGNIIKVVDAKHKDQFE